MIELNTKEYIYPMICKDVGWKESTGKQKQRQIKCIEESFKFYHPINPKTKKPKKSYIFTEMIKEPVLEGTWGGKREGAGRKNQIPIDEFNLLWEMMCRDLYRKNNYAERSWTNKIYFTTFEMYKSFGFDYFKMMGKVNFDEKDKLARYIFEDIVIGALKPYTITRICNRYGFKKNSLPKGILRSYGSKSGKKEKKIDDDELLPIYNQYEKEELEKRKLKTLIQAVKKGCIEEINENIEVRFNIEHNKYNVRRLNMIKVEDIDWKKDVDASVYLDVEQAVYHFYDVVVDSIYNSIVNRIEHGEKYKTQLNDNQKRLLKKYLFEMTGIIMVSDEEAEKENLKSDNGLININRYRQFISKPITTPQKINLEEEWFDGDWLPFLDAM